MVALLDGFTITEGSDPHLHHFYLRERTTGKVFYEGLGYVFIELQKFNKREAELLNDLDRWLFVLKNMSRLEKFPLYLCKPIFEKVFDIATYNKLDKEERMAYDMSLKKKWDEYSIKETAFNDGIEEGIERGIQRGKEEGKREEKHTIARELLKIGLPIKQIAATTGLTEEEIKDLS